MMSDLSSAPVRQRPTTATQSCLLHYMPGMRDFKQSSPPLGSNLDPSDYETRAIPLRHNGNFKIKIVFISTAISENKNQLR